MHAIAQSKATRWHRWNLLRSTFSASLPSACRRVWRHESQRSPSTYGDDALQRLYCSFVFVRCFVTHLPGVSASYRVFSSDSLGCPSTLASWQADVLNSPLVLVARTDAEAATMIDSNIDTDLQSKSNRGLMNPWMKKWKGVIWVLACSCYFLPFDFEHHKRWHSLTHMFAACTWLSRRHICLVTSDRTVCGSADVVFHFVSHSVS